MREHVSLGGFATFVNCLAVSPTTPAKGCDEFVQWVRSHPGKANNGVLSDCGHGCSGASMALHMAAGVRRCVESIA